MTNIKQLTEKDYDQIFSLSQYAFQYELSHEELEKKKAEATRHKIWGWMEGEEMGAKLHIIPLASYINGKPFNMGGISSVATWPEYRRKGLVKELLRHALRDMKKNGQHLSLLHPFSFPFYHKYGWEYTFTEQHYSIPINKLKKDWEASGYVKRSTTADIPLLHQLYTSYAKSYNGMLVRDEAWWKQRVIKDQPHIAVGYNEQHKAEGYIIFTVKDNVFAIKEIIYNSLNGRKLLLQFIGNHDSMVEHTKMIVPEDDQLALLVDDPRFEQKLIPYFMARIVDVPAFLAAYPFQADGSFSILVEDKFFPENNGNYHLRIGNGQAEVSAVRGYSGNSTVYCSIQTLSGMLLGYRRAMDYYRLGQLEADLETMQQLEKVIPQRNTFFADFF